MDCILIPVSHIGGIASIKWLNEHMEDRAHVFAAAQEYRQVAQRPNDMMARRALLEALRQSGRTDERFIQHHDVYYNFPNQRDLAYNYGMECYRRGFFQEVEKVLSKLKEVGDMETQRKEILASIRKRLHPQSAAPKTSETQPHATR